MEICLPLATARYRETAIVLCDTGYSENTNLKVKSWLKIFPDYQLERFHRALFLSMKTSSEQTLIRSD